MVANTVISPYSCIHEQNLVSNLIEEATNIFGVDVLYMPRRSDNRDSVFNEDDLAYFDTIYNIKGYVKNVDGFEGEGDFLSKFGLEIKDSITFTISKPTFESSIANNEPTLPRPREGDIIYFPLNKKIFEVEHVEHEPVFYQMGSLQAYDVRCELFSYSQERFTTGNTDIDTLFTEFDLSSNAALANVASVDRLSDNFDIETEADTFIDFSAENPFGDNSY